MAIPELYTINDMVEFATWLSNNYLKWAGSVYISKNGDIKKEHTVKELLENWVTFYKPRLSEDYKFSVSEQFRVHQGIRQFYSHLTNEWVNV